MPQEEKFPSEYRILKPSDFKWVFNDAIRSSDKLITILARKRVKGPARLGLAISKKQLRKAVHRNKVKRLTREYFRLNKQNIAVCDYVVMARKNILDVSNKEIRDSLKKQFNFLKKRLMNSQ